MRSLGDGLQLHNMEPVASAAKKDLQFTVKDSGKEEVTATPAGSGRRSGAGSRSNRAKASQHRNLSAPVSSRQSREEEGYHEGP